MPPAVLSPAGRLAAFIRERHMTLVGRTNSV